MIYDNNFSCVLGRRIRKDAVPEKMADSFRQPDFFLAPEGRQHVARGVSPWMTILLIFSPEGATAV